MDSRTRTAVAQNAILISVISTTLVVIFKLVASGLSDSISVLAESIQSLLDVALSLAAFWTIKFADKPADEDHPFGHGKAELLLSAFQMVLVIGSAGIIAWQAASHLHDPQPIKPGWGLAAMGYAVLANTAMVVFLKKRAKQTLSPALDGEAEHLRGDIFASLGIIVGLLLYQATGIRQIDPIVAILFTILGAFFALRKLKEVLHPLMDGALPPAEIDIIAKALYEHPETRGFHNVLTKKSGLLRVVTLHVMLDDHLSFVEAHDIAEHIESELSTALGGALVTVHYEPYEAEMAHRKENH